MCKEPPFDERPLTPPSSNNSLAAGAGRRSLSSDIYNYLDYRYRNSSPPGFCVSFRSIMLPRLVLPIILLLVIIGTLSKACDLDQMQYGCRIYNAQCRCGYGCSSEYRYSTNDDCKEALRGRRSDICYRSKPCLNGGSCLQISSDPGFKCRCEGTGYYGPHCDKPCPGPNNQRFRGPFPYECVVI